MLWCFLFAALAAAGLLSVLWALFGWLLPGGQNGITVVICGPGADGYGVWLRWRWLRWMGLAGGRMLLVGGGLSEQERERLGRKHFDIEFCTPEELPSRLELERDQLG